ncbi:MAG: dTDP-4-dehydrorhamnose 3,5-epimerase [Fluviicola sp. XM-24bin1]|nr:MAG: dTDP-4-dehydrorhamnose 3,5-epimerase [Fluviicola sp. XM-24bin1]
MKKTSTGIEDLYVIEPTVHGDDRGYFMESFSEQWFQKEISDTRFVQDNESKSSRGVLRGLHFQNPPMAQAKLVRVVQGEVLDVAVDLRKNSPTYGKHFSVLLSAENKKQLFVPRGFAHGFSVLSETAVFSYKVDNFYSQEMEEGILWNDPELNIDWHLPEAEVRLSEKDKTQQRFADYKSQF